MSPSLPDTRIPTLPLSPLYLCLLCSGLSHFLLPLSSLLTEPLQQLQLLSAPVCLPDLELVVPQAGHRGRDEESRAVLEEESKRGEYKQNKTRGFKRYKMLTLDQYLPVWSDPSQPHTTLLEDADVLHAPASMPPLGPEDPEHLWRTRLLLLLLLSLALFHTGGEKVARP